jgi:hypothetical protein
MVVPYFINAIQCIPPVFDDGKAYDWFARVAKSLRKDSILATYVTATVGAIIAFYLANRNKPASRARPLDQPPDLPP